MTSQLPPVACTLTTKAAVAQALEWTDLRSHLVSSEALDDGVRMFFPVEHQAALLDLVEREKTCCSFLDIITRADPDRFMVQITSPNPDALPVIALLGGHNK